MKFYVPIFYYADGKICVDAENQKDALSFASKLLNQCYEKSPTSIGGGMNRHTNYCIREVVKHYILWCNRLGRNSNERHNNE